MDFGDFLAVFEGVGIEDPIVGLALVVVASLSVFIVILIPILKPIVLDMAPFAYPNARIRAMESQLITKTKLEEMLEASSVVDVVGYLEGTDYEAQLAKIRGGSAEDVSSVEAALYESQKSAYHKIMTVAPDAIRGVFAARLKIYEVKFLKMVLRSLHAKVPLEQALSETPFIGNIDVETFYGLQSIEEFISKIEDTEYGPALSDAIATYSDKKSVQPIEMALDQYAYEKLWNTIRTVSEQNLRALRFFFGTEIDVINLRTLMRAKADGISSDEIRDYIMPMGFELNLELLSALIDVPDVEGMISLLEGKSCGEALSESLSKYEAKKSVLPLEMALEAHLSNTGRKISVSQPFGIGPFVGFLCSKDVEIRNLRALIRGIGANMPKDKLKDMLIMV